VSKVVEPIYLLGIPIPPSVNGQYATVIRNGRPIRIPSKTAREYDRLFSIWELRNRTLLRQAQGSIREWGTTLEIQMFLVLGRERLLTKQGKVKRLDVTNRSKKLHDLLADALGCDDSLFTSTPMEKVIADVCDEQVVIVIRPHPLRCISKVEIFDHERDRSVKLNPDQVALVQAKLPVA